MSRDAAKTYHLTDAQIAYGLRSFLRKNRERLLTEGWDVDLLLTGSDAELSEAFKRVRKEKQH